MLYLFLTLMAILIVVVTGNALISAYNRLVMLKFNIDKSFANIEVLLKQRAEEVPNLIKVLEGNVEYESSLMKELIEIRTKFLNGQNTQEKVQCANQMEQTMKSIFAISEQYPELKASQSFLDLQSRVSHIEERISDRREFFNESVNLYNIGIHAFPGLIMAKILRYREQDLLKISQEEKVYHGIQFSAK